MVHDVQVIESVEDRFICEKKSEVCVVHWSDSSGKPIRRADIGALHSLGVAAL